VTRPERITRQEIDDIKRQHILKNLLYTPVEASQVLAVSVRTIFELVRDGRLVAANQSAANGGSATRGTRITAESLEVYRQSIVVTPDNWLK
jgi:hypothetical protein